MTNNEFLNNELRWLAEVIVTRMKLYFNQETAIRDIMEIKPQPISGEQGAYAAFISKNGFGYEERLGLILSFVPLLKPQLLDCFNVKNSDTGQRFVEFGCEERDNILLPTLSTLYFILCGDDVERRIILMGAFSRHPTFTHSAYFPNGSRQSQSLPALQPSDELTETLIFERKFVPAFTSDFPARKLTTERSWDELVLDESTMKMVNEIRLWVEYGDRIRGEWQLGKVIKPGFRVLFYGPSGSGKTFTASLLGKVTGKDVYCIDLSMVVSKYIGETEKNLSKVFQLAEDKDWILFFDEADALFGKRTGLKDAHDRYANQEVAYLLQRVEDYRGLVVLSTNLKTNMDEAFSRRFQSVIRFPMPDAEQREQLWRNTFSPQCSFDEETDLKEIAKKHELAGGSILNVVQYASVMAMSRGEKKIRNADIIEGIRREFQKDGKMMR